MIKIRPLYCREYSGFFILGGRKIRVMKRDKLVAHMLMILLVFAWGFDYIPVKYALKTLTPMCFLFGKYIMGFIIAVLLKVVQKNRKLIRKKDIPFFIICSIFGEIAYFNCEYTAIGYISVSATTIILALVPAVSMIIERILFKKKTGKKAVAGIVLCIFGVSLVIGADYAEFFNGGSTGYILAFAAVLCWNVYNYVTSALEQYDSVTLACTQMLCTLILLSPAAIHSMPLISEIPVRVYLCIIYTGVLDAGLGFIIVIYGLKKLGPTISAIYSNVLPVTSTFFGWIFLSENISLFQIAGGIIVISAGYVVIREKQINYDN